jgi:electron transfer flavoprotein beta subunit
MLNIIRSHLHSWEICLVDIVVLVKDTVELSELKVDPATRRPILLGLNRRIGDLDKRAVEAAVQLRDKHGGKVILVSLGDDKTRTAIREALAMGADEAYLLRDSSFEGSDTLVTSRILAAALRRIGRYDLILCGEMTLDSLSAQVGPRVSELLGLPLVAYARRIEVKGDRIVAERSYDMEDETVEVSMPVLISVVREINEPRTPALMSIMRASKKPIQDWNREALGLQIEEVGSHGSGIKVLDVKAPLMERKRIIFKAETPEEAASSLVDRLFKDGVLK